MKKAIIFLVFVMVLIQSGCIQDDKDFKTDKDFELLFNGSNLTGWITSKHIRDSIQNGVLRLSNDQSAKYGYVLTNRDYRNFHLKFDYKLNHIARTILLVRFQADSLFKNKNGYEISLMNTENTQHPSGSIVNISRAFWPDSIRLNDWNRFEIIVDGDYIRTFINGQKVTEIHDRRSAEGKIGFKTVKGRFLNPIEIKNVLIKEFPDNASNIPLLEDEFRNMQETLPVSMFNGDNLDGWDIVGDGIWMAENGIITGRTNKSEFSFLKSKKTYKDFYLKLKFKIEKENNSGIFIRQHPDSTNINLNTGLEFNIYDHNGFSYAWPTGSVVSKARAFIGLVDYNDWNTMEIFARGNHTCTYVNGIKTSEYYTNDLFNRTGNICLQIGVQVAQDSRGGSKIKFKDIFITTP